MKKTNREDLKLLFQEYNQKNDNTIEGAEEIYFDRLERELTDEEMVNALVSFNSEYKDMHMKTNFRAALLVITSVRVIQMAGSVRFLSSMKSPKDQARSSEELEVASVPYESVRGVAGRRTILSLGLSRELYLDLKAGSFLKIQGLSRARSELVEELIRQALIAH